MSFTVMVSLKLLEPAAFEAVIINSLEPTIVSGVPDNIPVVLLKERPIPVKAGDTAYVDAVPPATIGALG